jgi:2-methylcitrate dehydratase PrpD
LRPEDLPETVRHEAKRALINMLATTLAGCREPAVEKALAVLDELSGRGAASLIGRGARRDPALAAFVNAAAANIHDFDDTHPPTIIHPTAPVAPAVLALAEAGEWSGAGVLRAFVIGAEIACRLGNAASPGHYARGWHVTSTCGVVGAAAGAGALIGLDAQQMVWAMGNAAAQAAGLVGTLGTMAKSVSVGNAARNGLVAALLAREGFSGQAAPLTGAGGFLPVFGEPAAPGRLTEGLGESWEFGRNTYKPYPVGVVLNPVIDASREIAAREGFRPGAVESVELTGHPLLRQRTDRPGVRTGREAQVSAQHAIAIVWRRGEAGLDEFTDAAVAETLSAGRPDVRFADDPSRDIASVAMAVRMLDGQVLRAEVTAARGSPGNPMTDADLERKLAGLAESAGFPGDVAALTEAVWTLDRLKDAGDLMRLAAAPTPQRSW